MQDFFNAYINLLDNLNDPIRRSLMSEIDWNHRLIGIKGTRGIGKTYFLLDYARKKFGTSRACLYVNLNNFYFTKNSLLDFADEFRKTGGSVLLLDQVYKYPNWSQELKEIYLKFPDLKVVFTGSSVMDTSDQNLDLIDKAVIYELKGLSFREFLNYHSNNQFKPIGLDDLLKYHESIAKDILFKVKPLAYFSDYLQYGYYPFYKGNQYFTEKLVKIMNLILEIDIPYLQQVEIKYFPKLKRLLYLIANEAPQSPNVSRLSNEIETSRATVMNYLKYLQNAHLLNLLYNGEGDESKKPSRVLLNNSNIQYAIASKKEFDAFGPELFFVNQLNNKYIVKASHLSEHYLLENKYQFKIESKKPVHLKKDVYYAVNMIEYGAANQIPLWLFGFLY